MFSFFTENIINALNNINVEILTEIRLRANQPIICFSNNKKNYLSENGLTLDKTKSIICTYGLINKIIEKATENSIYAYNDEIINGYITTNKGVRIGVSGECVFDREKIITIKNYSSLCIRIPHDIIGCSDYVYNKIFQNKLYNLLIISAPGGGKTTIIKDLIRNFNTSGVNNVLVIDERGELNVMGENIDVIKYSNKNYALEYSVKSLAPQFIFLDEISTKKDLFGVGKAINSGVKVVCSMHGDNLENAINNFPEIIKIFDRFLVLYGYDKPGIIKGVFDNKLNEI